MSKLSVIIPVRNEEEKLTQVLQEVLKLNPFEIITVINGSTDKSREIAELYNCVIYEYPVPLGHDTGRAIGANFSAGDILLFLDGDMIIPYKELMPFIKVINEGADIALNDLQWLLNDPQRPHSISVMKKALNDIFAHGGLSLNSMVAIPHAISRKALEEIGWYNLSIPPLAQAIAMNKQLNIVTPKFVDVITLNKIRPELHLTTDTQSPYVLLENIIIGDHLNAIHYLINSKGERGGFPDHRNRMLVNQLMKRIRDKTINKSSIICDEENAPLTQLVKQVRNLQQAGSDEVIVVTYDSNEEKITALLKEGIHVIPLNKNLGSCVTRSVGAFYSNGDKILFTHPDQTFSSKGYQLLFKQLEKDADISLLEQGSILESTHPIDEQHTLRFFLNLLLSKPELWNNSLYAFPHAMKRSVIEDIGYLSLMIPPLAQAVALMKNYRFSPIQLSEQSSASLQKEDNEVFKGDHIEAVAWFLSMTDARGAFSSGDKDYKAFEKLARMASMKSVILSEFHTYFNLSE